MPWLAAQRATEEDLAALEDNYSTMAACAQKEDWQAFARLDLQFHMQLGQITGNSLICRTYRILYDVLMDSMDRIVERMGATALSYHRRLIDAIAAHDSAAAETIALAHLENNREYL